MTKREKQRTHELVLRAKHRVGKHLNDDVDDMAKATGKTIGKVMEEMSDNLRWSVTELYSCRRFQRMVPDLDEFLEEYPNASWSWVRNVWMRDAAKGLRPEPEAWVFDLCGNKSPPDAKKKIVTVCNKCYSQI